MNLRRSLAALILLALSLPALAQTPRDFSKETARPTVEWARDGVIYEIYPRVFSASGDFNGVTARLDEMKKTGVDILWLMPINPIGEKGKKGGIGSPYAVRDYYGINPAYGTKEDLKRLVAEAHKRGMKVITDQVLNHTAWDNKLLTEHPEFYHRNAKGEVTYPYDWSDVAWLDYSNPKLRAYIIDMLKYWVREFDLDGFRFDVAHEVPTDFWEQARVELEKVKPQMFWLAEAHKAGQQVKAMDADYSWPLHSTLTDVMQGRKPASALKAEWEAEHSEWPKGALHMRFSDNHDERRAIARFGEKGALAAQAFMFTLDGIPLVYNGMETGDTSESGDPALFEKQLILWQFAKRRPEFPRFYQRMIALRRSSDALRRGDLVWVKNSNDNCVLSFLRRTEKEQVLSVINTCGVAFNGLVNVPGEGYTDVTPNIDSDEASKPQSPTTLPAVLLDAWGFKVYRKTVQ